MIRTSRFISNKTIFSLVFFILLLSFFTSAMAKKDNDGFLIKTESVSLPRSASTTSYTPLGTAEHDGLCKYRGHIGKIQCIKVTAKKHDRYNCKGKGVYYSKVDGKKGCYTCPKNFKRTKLTRKMDHAEACVNRKGKNKYARATRFNNTDKCGSGQFKHKGYCKSCPAHTNRGLAAKLTSIDSGKCKVERAYRCNDGLKLYKSVPENVKDRVANWTELSHKKYCGKPANINVYLAEVLLTESNVEIVKGMVKLGEALGKATGSTLTKVNNIKKAMWKGELGKANRLLKEFPEFLKLKADLAESGDAFSQAGAAIGPYILTLGFVADASVFAGGNYEFGMGYDVASGDKKKYKTYGLTKGASAGKDGSVNIGVWKGELKDSYAQGYTVGFPVGKGMSPVGIDGSVGIWSDYYTPNRADNLNQPHFVGISMSLGAGVGWEVGEYAEAWTDFKN